MQPVPHAKGRGRRCLPYILLPFFLLPILPATAQSAKIQALKSDLTSLSGEALVDKTLELAIAFFEVNMYPQAAVRAEEAAKLAKKMDYHRGHALALHWEGKALQQAERKNFFGKSKATAKFEQSNKVMHKAGFKDEALFLANLEGMRDVAQADKRTDEAQRLEQQVAALGDGKPSAPVLPTPTPTKSTEEMARKISRQNAMLAQQSAELRRELEEKEAAISQMSEVQMRSELMLMQQRQLLDSMAFRNSLDSVNLLNKELMLTEAKTSRNFLFAVVAALFLLFGGSTFSYLKSIKYNRLIRKEQQRSEELLLNILPALVAEELIKQGYTKPQFHDSVAVLFADFVGFSKIAEVLSPQVLVRELDTAFKAFDNIIQENGLEKIKTIGDAYMCAAGLNGHDKQYILRMVRAAKQMQAWLDHWNTTREGQGQPRFDARIGIHAGPVVAGVVGSKKFAFDIWGDTVNIAARVEQAGEGGRINLSRAAYEHVKDEVPCQYRGAIEAKNKGKIEMYYVA